MVIERENEEAVLAKVVERVWAGTGSFVLIGGGLGTGRSALLHAAGELATERGLRVVRAVASPMEQRLPYGVVRQLFEPLLGRGGRTLPDEILLERASAREREPDGGARREHLLLHELRAMLTEITKQEPLALLVDDLQWADAASLRWLAYLANRLREDRLLVVTTLLEGDVAADAVVVKDIAKTTTTTVRARPLSADGVGAMLSGRCGMRAEDEFVRACHALTGGNPMIVEALAIALRTHDVSLTADRLPELAGIRPSQTSARLGRCLRAQPHRVGAAARAMAVLGEPADSALVAELAGLDLPDFDEAARALRRLGLVADSGLLRFVGSSIGDAIADSMTAGEQDALHLRAATVFYRRGWPVEQVAGQLLATAAEPEPWAVDALRSAAGSATSRSAPRTAARYMRHALAHPGADRGALLVDLAGVERSYDLAASYRHLNQALPMLRDPAERAFALGLAPVLAGARHSPDARLVRRTLADLRDAAESGPDEAELALRLEARLRFLQREEAGAATSALDRLREMGTSPSLESSAQRELVTVLLNLVTLAEAAPRDSVAGLAHRILSREPGSAAQMYSALPLAFPVLIASDALGGVESWLAGAAGPDSDEPDLPTLLAWSAQATAWLGAGLVGRAKERALSALSQADPDWTGVTATCLWTLAEAAIELRDVSLARFTVRRCETEHEAALKSFAQGALALTTGNRTGAIEYLGDCARQLARTGRANVALFPLRSKIALQLAATDQPERAEQVAAEDSEHALRWGAPSAIGRALRVRATLLGEDEAGVQLLHEAVEVLGTSANRLELAKTLVLLGERSHAGTEEAERYLLQGRRIAAECGVPWLAQQVTGEPHALRSRGDAAPGPLLTATERRVVDLAVAGRRNKDIAELLDVSVRAVEKHLTSSYRKLGISGRADLADAVDGGQREKVRGPRAG